MNHKILNLKFKNKMLLDARTKITYSQIKNQKMEYSEFPGVENGIERKFKFSEIRLNSKY